MKGSIHEERSTADSPDRRRICKRGLPSGICAKLCRRRAGKAKCRWRSCEAKFGGPASHQGRIRVCFAAFKFKRFRETHFAHRASDFARRASDQAGLRLSLSAFAFKVSRGLLCPKGNQSIANAVTTRSFRLNLEPAQAPDRAILYGSYEIAILPASNSYPAGKILAA